MIVNIIGAPVSGKSTLASKFVLEHTYWTYLSIDMFREKYSEEESWRQIEYEFIDKYAIIFESCGLSWQLEEIIKEYKELKFFTIALIADRAELHRRLTERHQRKQITNETLKRDEHEAIDWVSNNLNKCKYPINMVIKTDNQSPEQNYQILCKRINYLRLKGDI